MIRTLTIGLILLTSSTFAQYGSRDLVSNDTIQQIERQSMGMMNASEGNLSGFNSPQKEGIINLQDNIKAKHYDQKWLKELSDKNVFTNLYADIHKSYDADVTFEELSTDLLRQRLELLNQKTPFHIEYNPILERVIKTFLKNRREALQRLMNISQYYFPMFEQELVKHKIPLEIKYLAIVESALNPKAGSRMGAQGLWQFMYQTGKMYGLEVSNYVDERSDPLRSTQAAMKYLNRLYSIFGDWDLVLAAYNSGPGNVTKAMRRSGGKTNYWNLRPYLPNETAGYIPAFLATLYIFEYAKEHGFRPEKRNNIFFDTDTIQVKRHIPFQDIADVVGMTEQEIEFLNPSYSLNVVPYVEGKNYGLRLPIEVIGKFVNNEEIIYAYIDQRLSEREKPLPELLKNSSTLSQGGKYHKVQKGDNLGRIAAKYGTTITNLKKWNNLKGTNIQVGQRLIVRR
ncbi:hypothetical protein RCZ15_14350 [Capnocytophaga catalasegens]|uniref:LysM domain-containing protein n=2 Tax=Capnocytophaga catalasegens TaxID=1004260 RepID=A0AAV5AY72_9FLAO|nr:hypothetical protein RCZ03_19750 [Capnocytophaga catalasegens]GJM50462.1 hypothetical protein RCZ15_14350 [Capnocytophaga catalasegens]GJM53957.1 hypothetical protein RCZ16_22730 [Capnocytophaga catalasegens]